MDIIKELKALEALTKTLNPVTLMGISTVTLDAEKFNLQQIKQIVAFLKRRGATLNDDKFAYDNHGPENTCHYWINSHLISLSCGFQFKGEQPLALKNCLQAWHGKP